MHDIKSQTFNSKNTAPFCTHLHIHSHTHYGIIILFWFFFSTVLLVISNDIIHISCWPVITNRRISLSFITFLGFLHWESTFRFGVKIDTGESSVASKAWILEGLINQDPKMPLISTLGSEAHSYPWGECGSALLLSSFLLYFCGTSKNVQALATCQGVISLFKESVKYFHIKWRASDISKNLSLEGLLKVNKGPFILEENLFFLHWLPCGFSFFL